MRTAEQIEANAELERWSGYGMVECREEHDEMMNSREK